MNEAQKIDEVYREFLSKMHFLKTRRDQLIRDYRKKLEEAKISLLKKEIDIDN